MDGLLSYSKDTFLIEIFLFISTIYLTPNLAFKAEFVSVIISPFYKNLPLYSDYLF